MLSPDWKGCYKKMGRVTITIDKREYAIACDDGQEAHIVKLSRILDEKAKMLSSSIGRVNENMLLAMVGLLLADELEDIKSQTACVPASALSTADSDIAKQIDGQVSRIVGLINNLK